MHIQLAISVDFMYLWNALAIKFIFDNREDCVLYLIIFYPNFILAHFIRVSLHRPLVYANFS